MKDKAISKIIINHINAGNLELNGICVNDLVKDITSELAELEQERLCWRCKQQKVLPKLSVCASCEKDMDYNKGDYHNHIGPC